ncbi:MAG: hypothetical protein HC800_21625 [Phormidesmis sp. RL_2_1]|nr:hypothetical protein [Phormidesmis sp. RL_2_1]
MSYCNKKIDKEKGIELVQEKSASSLSVWLEKIQFQLFGTGAVEMETAALFIAAFACKVPCGALLLVSDLPLVESKPRSLPR